jgi:hypothetical protein
MLAKRGDLLDDLGETFGNLQKFRMKLNLKKYVFGVSSEKIARLCGIHTGNRCQS